MRIDRILVESEAVNALRRMRFEVHETDRPGLYEVSHPHIDGVRIFTIEQITTFAEGAAVIESNMQAIASATKGGVEMFGGGSGGM